MLPGRAIRNVSIINELNWAFITGFPEKKKILNDGNPTVFP